MNWYVQALRSGVPFPSGETLGRAPDEGWPTGLGGEQAQPAAAPFNLRKKRRRKGKPAISRV